MISSGRWWRQSLSDNLLVVFSNKQVSFTTTSASLCWSCESILPLEKIRWSCSSSWWTLDGNLSQRSLAALLKVNHFHSCHSHTAAHYMTYDITAIKFSRVFSMFNPKSDQWEDFSHIPKQSLIFFFFFFFACRSAAVLHLCIFLAFTINQNAPAHYSISRVLTLFTMI